MKRRHLMMAQVVEGVFEGFHWRRYPASACTSSLCSASSTDLENFNGLFLFPVPLY